MKIITSNPIEVQSGCCGGKYSSLDASSLSVDISAFQKFAKSKGAQNANGSPLTVDGKWGPNTMAAWITYGKEWDLMQNTKSETPKPKASPTNKEDTPMNQSTAQFAKDNPNKKTLKDKWKALPLHAKIGIGVTGASLLGLIIYLCIPKGKKK